MTLTVTLTERKHMLLLNSAANDELKVITEDPFIMGFAIFIGIFFLLLFLFAVLRICFYSLDYDVEDYYTEITYQEEYKSSSDAKDVAVISSLAVIPGVLITWWLIYVLLPYVHLGVLMGLSILVMIIFVVSFAVIVRFHARMVGFKWKDNRSKFFTLITGVFIVLLAFTPVYLLHIAEYNKIDEIRVNEYSLVNKNGVSDTNDGWINYGENNVGKVTVNFFHSDSENNTVKVEALDSLVTVNYSKDNDNTVVISKDCFGFDYVNNDSVYEKCRVIEYELFLTE